MVCVADDPELGFVGKPVEMNVQMLRDLYNAGHDPGRGAGGDRRRMTMRRST
jgi:hypothetical protein